MTSRVPGLRGRRSAARTGSVSTPARALGGAPGRHGMGRLFGLLAAAALVMSLSPAPVVAATGLTVTTPYPDVAVAPGTTVTFALKVVVTQTRQVAMSVAGTPTGWTAAIHGGGYTVEGVVAGPSDSPSLQLSVKVPADAAAKTYGLTVTARSGSLEDTLPVQIRVDSAAAGSVSMTSDFPSLQGSASSSFNFTVTLANDTGSDLTFALSAQGPTGWTVNATPTSQSQASSVTVNAGSSSTVSVSASPPSNVTAGTYKLDVTADAGSHKADLQLSVQITGSYSMSLSTPDQNLTASGNAGSVITRSLTIDNTGSAALTNVSLTSTPPTGWTVKFNPASIASIQPNQTVDVNAEITPAKDAIAGDYVVTMKASTQQANSSQDIRVTIETSLTWAVVGIALIVLTLVGLGWVFTRYGRR